MAFNIYTQAGNPDGPIAIATGDRVLSLSFVGASGGGTLTITPVGRSAQQTITVLEGKPWTLDLPATGTPQLGGGSTIAWTNIDVYSVVTL